METEKKEKKMENIPQALKRIAEEKRSPEPRTSFWHAEF